MIYSEGGPTALKVCQSPFFSFSLFYAMHEVTPSAVAMADSTLMAVWIANFQNVLFFMVQNFNVLEF